MQNATKSAKSASASAKTAASDAVLAARRARRDAKRAMRGAAAATHGSGAAGNRGGGKSNAAPKTRSGGRGTYNAQPGTQLRDDRIATSREIQAIVAAQVLPDLFPPVAYGLLGRATSTPLKLHEFDSMSFSPNTAQPAYDFAQGELAAGVLTHDPRVGLVEMYYELSPTAVGLESPSGQLGFAPQVNDPIIIGIKTPGTGVTQTEVSYSAVDPTISFGPLVWCNGNQGVGAGNTVLTLGTSTGTFGATTSINYVRLCGDLVSNGVILINSGGGTSTCSFILPGPGWYSFAQANNTPTGAGASVWPAGNGIFPINFTLAEPAGLRWDYYPIHGDTAEGDVSTYFDKARVTAGRIVATNLASLFSAEGAAIGVQLPPNVRLDHLGYTASGQAIAGINQSLFNVIGKMDGAELKTAVGGASEFSRVSDLTTILGADLGGKVGALTATGQANASDNLPALSAFGGAAVLVMKTGLTNTAGRDGMWQFWWHFEGSSMSQLFPQIPPQVSIPDVEYAMKYIAKIRSFSGNANHFVEMLKQLGKTGFRTSRALGPTATAVGTAMMSNPSTAVPGAITSATGGVMTLVGEIGNLFGW